MSGGPRRGGFSGPPVAATLVDALACAASRFDLVAVNFRVSAGNLDRAADALEAASKVSLAAASAAERARLYGSAGPDDDMADDYIARKAAAEAADSAALARLEKEGAAGSDSRLAVAAVRRARLSAGVAIDALDEFADVNRDAWEAGKDLRAIPGMHRGFADSASKNAEECRTALAISRADPSDLDTSNPARTLAAAAAALTATAASLDKAALAAPTAGRGYFALIASAMKAEFAARAALEAARQARKVER